VQACSKVARKCSGMLWRNSTTVFFSRPLSTASTTPLPGFVLRADDGHEILVPFEQRDFIQAQHSQAVELIPINFAGDGAPQHAAQEVIADLMLGGHIADCAVDQFQQQKLRKSFCAVSLSVIPITVLSGDRVPAARQAAVTFGLQDQKDRTVENRQMTKHQLFSVPEKLRRARATLVTNGEMLRVLDLQRNFGFCQQSVYNAHLRQIQQIIE
jgi:hypothetical protein